MRIFLHGSHVVVSTIQYGRQTDFIQQLEDTPLDQVGSICGDKEVDGQVSESSRRADNNSSTRVNLTRALTDAWPFSISILLSCGQSALVTM